MTVEDRDAFDHAIVETRTLFMAIKGAESITDQDEADALDPVLKRIEQPSRRKRLIAQREQRDNNVVYKFDIYLRRERETVFFDV